MRTTIIVLLSSLLTANYAQNKSIIQEEREKYGNYKLKYEYQWDSLRIALGVSPAKSQQNLKNTLPPVTTTLSPSCTLNKKQ